MQFLIKVFIGQRELHVREKQLKDVAGVAHGFILEFRHLHHISWDDHLYEVQNYYP